MDHLTPQEVEALKLAEGRPATPAEIDRVAQSVGGEPAAWAFTQWALRDRASSKFERAGEMLFTRPGYEMASHQSMAAWHASLFPEGVEVVDATCGIGADLMALANRGPAIGLDSDPEHGRCARHNTSLIDGQVKVEEAEAVAWLQEQRPPYIFIDPARRSEGRRTLRPEDFSPPLSVVVPILQQAQIGVVKLSPMLDDELLASFSPSRTVFVSHAGQCPEVVLVFGHEVALTGRSVIQIESGQTVNEPWPVIHRGEPDAWFYEADPALVRAGAIGAVAGEMSLVQVGDTPGYLSGAEAVESVWLRRWRVLWQGAWRPKAVKAVLRSEGWSVDAVKVRGVRLDPVEVKKSVSVGKGQAVVLVLYSQARSIHALIVRPE